MINVFAKVSSIRKTLVFFLFINILQKIQISSFNSGVAYIYLKIYFTNLNNIDKNIKR